MLNLIRVTLVKRSFSWVRVLGLDLRQVEMNELFLRVVPTLLKTQSKLNNSGMVKYHFLVIF